MITSNTFIFTDERLEEAKNMWKNSAKWDVAKTKVLLLYICYPLAMASYFRKALEHRDDIDLKVVGPFTGAFIPWMGGMYLPQKYVSSPDIPLPFPSEPLIDFNMVIPYLGDWQPDIVLCVDAGINWKHRPMSKCVVTVGTDPHVLNYSHARDVSDLFFNMQAVYMADNDIYLPYAYSKYDHFPEDVPDPASQVDAVLIGMPYDQRIQWVNSLRSKGVSVIFENGPVYDDARALYNRGKIGLNWSSMEDLNARAFEIPAMGLYGVMNRVPDMGRFSTIFDNCGIFENNLNDAVEKVMWAVQNPEQAREKAKLALEAVKLETYDARVETILRKCGF